MEKEGRAGKGFLSTITKQGIAIKKLTKKPHPSFQLERMGWKDQPKKPNQNGRVQINLSKMALWSSLTWGQKNI
jgi:hypothetical protein